MYASLMGTFDLPAPINYIGSTSVGKSIATIVDRTDPWVLPSHHEPESTLIGNGSGLSRYHPNCC